MNKFSFIELSILQMLESGEMHGYAMSTKMKKTSEGNIILPAGSLYPALHKLEKSGLVSSMIQEKNLSRRQRRVYSLTDTGFESLQQEKKSWQTIVSTMKVLLGEA